MNVKNRKKMVNDMQFKDKTPLYTAVVKPSQRLQQPDEYIDPKYEAVLKQVREFLYQNMVSYKRFDFTVFVSHYTI